MNGPVRIGATLEPDAQGILTVTMRVHRLCPVCGIELKAEEVANGPVFYDDLLCIGCHTWLGRCLVTWMGTDPSVALMNGQEIMP